MVMDTPRKDQQANSCEPPPRSSQSENERAKMQAVATLLSHYWVGIENDALRRRLLGEWLYDLEAFSAANVVSSCTEWRRTQHRRPTPADIIALCREVQTAWEPAPKYVELPAPPPFEIREHWRELPIRSWTKAELETANMEAAALARQYGYNTGDDRKDRFDFFNGALIGKHPGYDAATGTAKMLHSYKMGDRR